MSATILVLEDDAVLQGLLCEVLEDEGFHVVAADTLPALIAAAPANTDLLISDLLIQFEPVGVDAVHHVRQMIDPALPCLICTAAQTQIETFRADLERLDVQILPKPFTIDDLLATIGRMLQSVCRPLPSSIAPLQPALAP